MYTLNIQENFPIGKKTSFHAGGNTRFFAEVKNVSELQNAISYAAEKGLPYFILGKGTNVLVSDFGYNGFIIRLGGAFSEFEILEQSEFLKIKSGAGVPLMKLAYESIKLGYSGIHRLAGIPGSLGGAVFMNAGAYRQEVSDVITKVESFRDGRLKTRGKSECDFKYRYSDFQKNHEIILSAELILQKSNSEILKEETREVLEKRKASQPLEKPNAGSAFKRNEAGPAGLLIEQAGLKGFQIGDAGVSEKHANFIVNLGRATANDIAKVFSHVQETVFQKLGVRLEREVIFLGDFTAK